MSEPRDGDGGEARDAEDAEDQTDGDEGQASEEDEGEPESEGDDEPPRKKAEDWEKRAHNAAGQAAREKSRRRAAEKRASDLEGRLSRLESSSSTAGGEDELMAIIASLPDTEEDPVGDIARVKMALRIFRARQLAEAEQEGQRGAIERQIEGLRSSMAESEEDFAADHPDYREAAKYYRAEREAELKDAGYAGVHLQRKLADDLFGLVRMSFESGQDPAERVYALAGKRGFKPGMKAADKRLDTLQRATDTGRQPAGKGMNGALSWGDVARLDGAARDKAWAKLRERERSRDRGRSAH
jgi:hypothetical protein